MSGLDPGDSADGGEDLMDVETSDTDAGQYGYTSVESDHDLMASAVAVDGHQSPSTRRRKQRRRQQRNDGSESESSGARPQKTGRSSKAKHKRGGDDEVGRDAMRKAQERQAKKKRKRETTNNRLLRQTTEKVKLLTTNARLDRIRLVDVRPKSSSTESHGRYRNNNVARAWQVCSMNNRRTIYMGATTLLSNHVFSSSERDKNTQTHECAVDDPGHDLREHGVAPGQGDLASEMAISGDESGPRRKCKHYGQIHGSIVHRELSELVTHWIQNNGFTNTMQLRMRRFDPCVIKIAELLRKHGWIPVATELPIFDEELCVATAVDLVCQALNPPRMIFIEIKTSTDRGGWETFLHGNRTAVEVAEPAASIGDSTSTAASEMPDVHDADVTKVSSFRTSRPMMRGACLTIPDTPRQRAAVQLLLTDIIMRSHYTECIPDNYQILFVNSHMPEPVVTPLPEWVYMGGKGQFGMNVRIFTQYIQQLRRNAGLAAPVETDAGAADSSVEGDRDFMVTGDTVASSGRPVDKPAAAVTSRMGLPKGGTRTNLGKRKRKGAAPIVPPKRKRV